MTVETTLQTMFDKYPTLFATRKDCYNHLFCTVGNGYMWKRGQIVRENCSPYSIPREKLVKLEKADYAVEHPPAKQTAENIKKLEIWKNFCKTHLKEYREWYPICEYSLIRNVPKNVKPDWAKAVEECRQMLKDDGIDPDKD